MFPNILLMIWPIQAYYRLTQKMHPVLTLNFGAANTAKSNVLVTHALRDMHNLSGN